MNEGGFVMNYTADEFSVSMTGKAVSSSLITGVMVIHVDECGDHTINWQAVPKTGLNQ
jgi:hypothetical protein